MKKYNRYELIYRQMSPGLRNKFIDKYNLGPYSDKDAENYKFDECMEKFIKDNPHNLELQRSCETFPALQDIPHPDRIPEGLGLNPIGREIMKDGYIEKIEEENAELHEKIDELKEVISALTDENTELKKERLVIADEKAGLAAELTELKTKQLDLTAANHELKRKIFGITGERDDLKDELSELQINFGNIVNENDKLRNQLSIFQEKMVRLTEDNTELKHKLGEPTAQFTLDEVNRERTNENGSGIEFTDPELPSLQNASCGNELDDIGWDGSPASSIYHKFFVPPLVKNRYRLLTNEEKDWIRENADLSEMDYRIFDLCCEHDSLKDVSEITELSYSKIKRTSIAIVEKIRIALDCLMIKRMSDDDNEE